MTTTDPGDNPNLTPRDRRGFLVAGAGVVILIIVAVVMWRCW